MRILHFEDQPFHAMRYAVSRAQPRVLAADLTFHRATVDLLPDPLSAIIATADLQGFARGEDPCGECPLALAVVREIERLRECEELPPKERSAVILGGDLQPSADTHDVQSVWSAFGNIARWVAGVAGNHDAFYGRTTYSAAADALGGANLHLLDATTVRLDGLLVGGVSGVVSTREGAWARTEADFASAVAKVTAAGVDVMISHDGPNARGTDFAGWPAVRRAVESSPAVLSIRGHDHWAEPYLVLANGTQVLNVEGRVVVLTAEQIRERPPGSSSVR